MHNVATNNALYKAQVGMNDNIKFRNDRYILPVQDTPSVPRRNPSLQLQLWEASVFEQTCMQSP